MGTVNALLVYICNIKLIIAALYFNLTLLKPACKTYELFSRSLSYLSSPLWHHKKYIAAAENVWLARIFYMRIL